MTAKHILIIDDDPTMRRLFGGRLAEAGFEVLYSGNGNEGRELARRLQPDLILLDIRLPDTDGFEIAQRLHEERQTAHIPIIFLTNEDLSLEAEKYVKELMVRGYIHKSVDLDEFAKRVQGFFKTSNKIPPQAQP